MLAKLRSDYPYHWQNIEVSNQDMKYPYRRARTVRLRPWAAVCAISTLRVKAKNVFGRESQIATYKFNINPPAYRTIWAYAAYILSAIGIILIIIRINL